ncbi:MAG TPA: zf-HC2 domain-containing protein [Terriglobales bacterium]|nr:zf-HC2 domain-containing protein [Terriglobales bacterium]
MSELKHNAGCQRDLVSAYLDDELGGVMLENFEAHLKNCSSCLTELRTQQQLLCTLDAAFSAGFDLPDDFARIVKTRAESDIGGVRAKKEGRLALQLTIVLAVASFALLGTAWRESILQPLRTIARTILSLSELAWQTISNAATGLAVIARLSGQAIILNPHRLGLLLLFIFLLAVSLLPRLIVKYHRTQTIE